jgi:FkbM family methyltransferase
MSQTSANRIIDALRLRLFWMKYGVFFVRSSKCDRTRIKVAGRPVRLSIPPGEEDAMSFEINNIFYNDCYGLRNMGGVNRILDVGGNVGLFSLAARNQFPKALIHSYEPNPLVHSHLLSNTKGLSIQVHPEAIGMDDGWIDMNSNGGSLLATTVASPNGKIKKTAIARALDRLGGTADLLKLDCEGGEWELFENQEIWRRINRLTMEYHLWANPQMDVPEMIRRIRSFGFRIINLCEESQWGIVHAIKV